jgi:hypothetical protein
MIVKGRQLRVEAWVILDEDSEIECDLGTRERAEKECAAWNSEGNGAGYRVAALVLVIPAKPKRKGKAS